MSTGPQDTPDEALEAARARAGEPYLCFLDSATGGGPSFVFAEPAGIFASKDARGFLRWSDGREEPADGDPFRLLEELLRAHPGLTAAGYWSYDLRYHVERLPRLAHDDLRLPDCWLGLYRGPGAGGQGPGEGGRQKAEGRRQKAENSGVDATLRQTRPEVSPIRNTQYAIGDTSSMSRPQYEAAVRRVLEYIGAGDCYQVNLSHRWTVPVTEAPWELYERLRRVSPAPYAAYLDCGDHQVLSSSPELFLRIRGCEVETRPIKGTRPRGRSAEEDAADGCFVLRSWR